MSAVELDRQGIERRDFPIVRRGYDPASVDAHLRALAAEIDELQREASSRGGESLASTAATQVQGILEATQATAEAIEHQAAEQAHQVRESADADARRTREEAVARAREHVAAVSQATEALLGHVGSLDGETRALVDSLRSGAGRLAGDLSAVEGDMEALYDAASGRVPSGGGGVAGETAEARPGENGVSQVAVATAPAEAFVGSSAEPDVELAAQSYVDAATEPEPLAGESPVHEEPLFAQEASSEQAPAGDLDGARLVALNMALNGDSRQDTGRYLAENFQIAEPERLLDEVYAAIEG